MSLREFLDGPNTYVLPPPGGSLAKRADFTDRDEDAYMASIAAMIKKREMSSAEAIDTLFMKMEQVRCQQHFGIEADLLIIKRLGEWIREIAN
jgi:hypothetical protein